MKLFTMSDAKPHSAIVGAFKIYADKTELIYFPLKWQEQGRQQTASGYGRKLTNPYMIRFEGKSYRLYTTCFSYAGSTWFISKGRKIFVD